MLLIEMHLWNCHGGPSKGKDMRSSIGAQGQERLPATLCPVVASRMTASVASPTTQASDPSGDMAAFANLEGSKLGQATSPRHRLWQGDGSQ